MYESLSVEQLADILQKNPSMQMKISEAKRYAAEAYKKLFL